MAATAEPVTPRYLTLGDASTYSGMSVSTLRRLIDRRALRAYRPHGRILIDARQLDALIQASAEGDDVEE